MKILKRILPIIFLTSVLATAQNINWKSINPEHKNLSTFEFGYDFGLTSQLGFYKFLNTSKPIYLGIDASVPMGNVILDDFKLRTSGLIKLHEINNYILSAKVSTIFTRHETNVVRMASFGTEFSMLVGYHKPGWHVSVELGHHKSISTHLKHSTRMSQNYPDIKDGWYIPTEGHFFLGIQGSKSINPSLDISFRAGSISNESNDEKPTIPLYTQIGLVKSF